MNIELKTDFDLNKTLRYKPFLFFFRGSTERSVRYNKETINLKLGQERKKLTIETDKIVDEGFINRIRYCLGADEDLSSFYELCSNDKILSGHMGEIKGIRIISAFSDFEALVSIICSQMVGFPQYISMLNKIYDAYGYFPEKEDIIKSPEKLDNCSLGYRKQFVINLAREYGTKDFSEIKGFGDYSVNIFNIFQKRDYSSFYKDCLITKIAKEYYNSDDAVKLSGNWGCWRGIFEVYLQKFLRDN